MKAATAAELRRIENEYMEEAGLPSLVLMETAAHSIALHVLKELRKGRVVVLCGTGKNGGDGLAAARHLAAHGLQTDVFLVGNAAPSEPDVCINIRALAACGVVLRRVTKAEEAAAVAEYIKGADLILDALLGIGLSGAVRPLCAEVIRVVNASGVPVLSVDMPSGICADTGRVMGAAVRAQETVTLVCRKRGHVLYPGVEFAGRVVLAGIGLPASALESVELDMLSAVEACTLLPVRAARSHKYQFGRVLSVAGCDNMPGAAVMAATAAYRAGAGLVMAAGTGRVVQMLQAGVKEAVTLTLADEGGTLCEASTQALAAEKAKASVVLLGSGLSDCAATEGFVEAFMRGINVPIVVDADALNILARHRDWLTALAAEAPVVLTPHMGEMSRLTGIPAEDLLEDTIGAAARLAKETGAIVLLKDARTIIAAPDGRVSMNPTGCSALAKAGSGDVLAGLIAGFAAQGLALYDAARAACYIHGLAGEHAAAEMSAYGVMASDLLDEIPSTIQYVLEAAE